jgi:hypothetical protein
MIHHVIYCLMAAFASQRMLIIDEPEKSFVLDNHFLPLSNTCNFNATPSTLYKWPEHNDYQQIVHFCPSKSSKDQIIQLGRFEESMYPYLPNQIFDQLEWINPDPPVWLVGQFAKYVLRPQPWFVKNIVQLRKTHPGKYCSSRGAA